MTISIDTLKNGIRVITEEISSIESVSVGIWINAGSRNERKEENGIAHFLEHMAFKGTKKRNALQIAEEIENVGGFINAYTSREITCYYAKVLKNHLPLAVEILSDIICNSIFNKKEIEVEKGVIIQEIGMMKDTPDDVIFELLQKEAFADTSLGRSILGSTQNIQSFKRQNFVDFIKMVREEYPEKVIVAGNVVTPEMVEELIINGADVVKIGIGPGSVCTTRTMTGVGVPQFSAIVECSDAANGVGGHIMADGGCVYPGDIAKAFGGGAHMVMIGGMLAGHDESEQPVVDGNIEFYGMSSDRAREVHGKRKDGYRGNEGRLISLPHRGPVNNTLEDILGGVRSACTYIGARRLKDMAKCASFVQTNNVINKVYEQYTK